MQRNLDTQPQQGSMEHSSAVINTEVSKNHAPDSFVKLKDMFFLYLGNWKWFVLSLIVALGCAYYYLRITPNIYRATASIMVKAEDKTGASEELLTSMGLHTNAINLTNEIMSLKTIAYSQQVVNRLNLSVEAYRQGAFYEELAYGIDLPVEVKFHSLEETDIASFDLQLNADSTITISGMQLNNNNLPGTLALKLGQTVKTPMGTVSFTPARGYVSGRKDDLKIYRRSMRETVNLTNKRVIAIQRNEKASIIDLSVNDVSRTRGEDMLSTLVAVYNENWVKDRNQITSSTTDFIRERLALIESELGHVDTQISDFKSSNLMLDVGSVGGDAYSRMNQSEDATREIDNRAYMVRYLRNLLTDGMHDMEQLPANTGINSGSIESQISEYNQLLLQRNNHLAVSSDQNPLVMDITQKLGTLRQSILASIDNEMTLLNTQRKSQMALRSQAVSKVAASPHMSQHLLSIERQQTVKESLYLFLLQKREENELSQAFTAYNTRLIEHPSSSPVPVEPDSTTVIMLATGIGLAIPALVLLLIESFNTAVRGRKDIEMLHAPFVGEIPQATEHKKKGKKGSKKALKELNDSTMVVKQKSRNVMNEAFRVVRTNLEFILGFEGSCHVVMLTSMNPGSGKTFITANLSEALAIKGKKVIALDLDLRRGSLSKYADSPEMGVSNYLSGQAQDFHELIRKVDMLDVLPVGTIPPNPTELLFNPRFPQMIEQLKKEYDYIFIDCPPVEIVADAAIISRYAEMTIFVIRAHLLDRAFLPDIEKWYQERRFPNLSILLNGTHAEFSHYGANGRYGYHRYGYHYGHYGEYGYSEEEAS